MSDDVHVRFYEVGAFAVNEHGISGRLFYTRPKAVKISSHPYPNLLEHQPGFKVIKPV